MTLGERIKKARKAAGLTQAQLAAACGWENASRVGNYEQGAREPSLEDLGLIAVAVRGGGHSLEWIVTGNEKAVLLGGSAVVSVDSVAPSQPVRLDPGALRAAVEAVDAAIELAGANVSTADRAGLYERAYAVFQDTASVAQATAQVFKLVIGGKR